jgi:hypothetical protein
MRQPVCTLQGLCPSSLTLHQCQELSVGLLCAHSLGEPLEEMLCAIQDASRSVILGELQLNGLSISH